MIAVIPVRDGVAPAGADEAISEASGRALIVGTNAAEAVADLARFGVRFRVVEASIDPVSFVDAVLDTLDDRNESLVLPASPDGRDLAPRIAHRMNRALFAGAVLVSDTRVSVAVRGGLGIIDHQPQGPFVATLQIGVRGSDVSGVEVEVDHSVTKHASAPTSVRSLDVAPPDASTMDLAEAPRILGGGAGLSDGAKFDQLGEVATALDASMGVTRVITDRGWAGHERQIGTTGVVVDPRLYISFGISGAVQHTSGLGQPDHIISVNTDAHCPMMQMSDLAIVSDANLVLDELASLLRVVRENVA